MIVAAASGVVAAGALLAFAPPTLAEAVRSVLNEPPAARLRAASDLPADYRVINLTPATARESTAAYDITKRAGSPPLTSEKAYVVWMLARYPGEQEKYLRERWARAAFAVEHGHIRSERILTAFLLTPREWFVRPYNIGRAYANAAMPIGYGQTISGPDLVARMTDRLDPQPGAAGPGDRDGLRVPVCFPLRAFGLRLHDRDREAARRGDQCNLPQPHP